MLLLLLALLAPLTGCGGLSDDCYSCDDDYYYDYDDDYLPPLQAVDDFYQTPADTTLNVDEVNGVLANDTFSDAFIQFPETTSRGGQLEGFGDGSFRYTPPAAFAGTDSFVYFLSDDYGESAAVVTLTVNSTGVTNPGIFVDSAVGNDATANPATGAPFASLTGALAQAGSNAEIVIRPGTGQPYSGNVTLQDGQALIGQGFENVSPQGQTRPIFSGSIALANDNLVRGLSFQNTNGDAINGDDSRNATISHCLFADSSAGGRAVSGERATGLWVISGNSIDSMDDAGLRLSASGTGVLTAQIANNTITNCRLSAISLLAEDSSRFDASVTGNVMSGNDPGFTFDVLTLNNSVFRLNLETNSNDDAYLLSTLNFSGTFGVENLSTLTQRNISGLVILDEAPGSTPISEIPDNSVTF